MKADLITQLEQLVSQEDIAAVIPAADEISRKLYAILEAEEREAEAASEATEEEAKESSPETDRTAENTAGAEVAEKPEAAEPVSPAEMAAAISETTEAESAGAESTEATEAEAPTATEVDAAAPEVATQPAEAEATAETASEGEAEAGVNLTTTSGAEVTINEKIRAVIARYKDRRAAWLKAVRAAEEANLAASKELLAEFETLIKEEENIGRAYAKVKELQEKWKTIGELPRAKRQEVQASYSKLNERFYYNINIYKELREHDLRKNLEAKKEIIARLDDVVKLESIQETEAQIRTMQAEWEEIGPTFKEEWEGIKEEYWGKVKTIYNKIRDFYEKRRASMSDNLKAKEALIEKAREVIAIPCETHADWEERTKAILEIQKEWRGVGFASKKDNDRVWDEFRGVCDIFFSAKKEFYNERNQEFVENRDKKKQLVDKAAALAESTDWKETSEKLIRLQKEWKKIGTSGQRFEHKLWRKFRGYCDQFFNAKKAHFDKQEEGYVHNLEAKQAVVGKIEAYELAEDAAQAVKDLKAFSQEFNAIGHVPRKDKDDIYKSYKAAIDKHYDALKMDKSQKEQVMFEAHVEQLKASPNANVAIRKETDKIRTQIRRLNDEIKQYENNLGFFANSKGAEKIIADVQKKIDRNKAEIDGLKDKLAHFR